MYLVEFDYMSIKGIKRKFATKKEVENLLRKHRKNIKNVEIISL